MTDTALPTDVLYGKVVGTFLLASTDGTDPDSLPSATPSVGTITFAPVGGPLKTPESDVLVVREPVTVSVNASGSIADAQAAVGVWLVQGQYKVTYQLEGVRLRTHIINVTSLNGADAPLDLTKFVPPGGPVLTVSEYADLMARLSSMAQTDSAVAQRVTALEASAPDLSSFATEQHLLAEAGYRLDGDTYVLEQLQLEATARGNADSVLSGRILDLENVPDVDLSGYATDSDLATGLSGKANVVHGHTSASISDWTEAVQDALAGFFNVTGATVSYNDAGNQIVIDIPSGITDPEAIRDVVGAAFVGVGNISIVINDPGDTITISTTATANSTDAALRDRSTHTGVQPISSVTGLQGALDSKATSAQGAKADTAVQPAALGAYATTVDVASAISPVNTRVTSLENAPQRVPNPSGQPDGKMLAVTSGELVFVDAPSGGSGSQTLLGTTIPTGTAGGDNSRYELGNVFTVVSSVAVSHVRVYAVAGAGGNSGSQEARIWRNSDGVLLSMVTLPNVHATGWAEYPLSTALVLDAGDYTVAATFESGQYTFSPAPGPLSSADSRLSFPAASGRFTSTDNTRPTGTGSAVRYGVDLRWTPALTSGAISDFNTAVQTIVNSKAEVWFGENATLPATLDTSRLYVKRATPGAVNVVDSLDRANSTTGLGTADTGQVWIPLGANVLGINGGQAYPVTAPAKAVLECGSADGHLIMKAGSSGLGVQGPIFRCVDASNFFWVNSAPGAGSYTTSIVRTVSGADTTIATYVGPVPSGVEFSVDLDGANIVLNFNGVPRITTSSTAHLTGTKHGMFLIESGQKADSFSFTKSASVVAPVLDMTQLNSLSASLSSKVSGTGITSIVSLTQAAYDALATKVATTLYVIT